MMPATQAPALARLISLDDPAATDPALVGAKAARLAALSQAGFPVPAGVVLPADAPAEPTALADALARLGGPVAVRSSAVAEDGAHASWAGQLHSVLDVIDVPGVLEAVAACRASAHSDRAVAYARTHGEAGGVAVLVQRMVPARRAGVAFSADPVRGDRDTACISAVAGLADALVSGEVSGDEWRVTGEEATAVAAPHGVLDAAAALQIAALARRVEANAGAPQDIEWAWSEEGLMLVQARPIVDLPQPPTAPLPDGNWVKDTAHFPGPMTPLGADFYVANLVGPINTMLAEWGLMPERAEFAVVRHEAYSRFHPDSGPTPPWWLLAVVARLAPPIRRKLAKAEEIVASGRLEQVAASWEGGLRDRLVARIEALRAVDLSALDDGALVAHLGELATFAEQAQEAHFRLFIPYLVGVHDLHEACAGLPDWDDGQTMELLIGLSATTSAGTHALAALAADVAADPDAAAVVRRAAPTLVDDLARVAPALARSLERWITRWGFRSVGYDPGLPSLAEQPERIGELLRDLLDGADRADLEARRQAAVARTRAALPEDARAAFDQALAFAERVYPVREDNLLYTDSLPGGLIRRCALEIGHRLAAAGHLSQGHDAVFLYRAELEALADPPADLADRVDQRRRELAWVRANPGPTVLGAPPPAAPDIRGLPAPARRLNGAILWAMAAEMAPPPPPREDGGIDGIGACAGVARGRVRVVRHASELPALQRGEVLVCPITTPSWAPWFSRAAALVTDAGSVLSHAAIIAREHGVPAVVATGGATGVLRDGMLVEVDGSRGTVTVLQA